MVGRRILSVVEVERILHRMVLEVMERHYGESLPLLMPASERGAVIAHRMESLFAKEGVSLPSPHSPAERLLLVDDVLYTGTTLMKKLLASGASALPAQVEVLVLVDRGHRRYPIYPDYVGVRLATTLHEYVRVRETGDGWEVWLE